MLIDFVIGFGGFITILVILAEGTKKPELGIMASLILLIVGLWVLGDGLQYKTGELTNVTVTGLNPYNSSEFSQTKVSANTSETTAEITGNQTINQTEAKVMLYSYAEVPATPYFSMVTLLALVMVLLSMYGLLHYAMLIFNY